MAANRWLLAAEADKIQDFLFRSARLREVVGGSQLLSRFCRDVPKLLLGEERAKHDVVVSDGGSFRVIFDTREEALRFGDQLAEVYRLAADGSLSVAPPVEFADNEFAQASESAEQRLRTSKQRRSRGATSVHIPYVALCASCGIGLAVTYEHIPGERQGRFLCTACRNKAYERRKKQYEEFLGPFLGKIVPGYDPNKLFWPGRDPRPDTKEYDPTADVADCDDRNYVAYLLADGNGMGEIFGMCNQEQMRQLSTEMTDTLQKCLAEATNALKAGQKSAEFKRLDVPALPLIIGGDDLFALIPAPWAVHFAATFCEAYEKNVTALVQRVLGALPPASQKMTCGAVVVICKSSYPYRLAHQVGERRIKQAKRISKVLAYERSVSSSVVDMEIILGSQLTRSQRDDDYRSTLRPYWISEPPEGWGLSISALLDARHQLRQLPGKRQAQLRELYQPDRLPEKKAELEAWKTDRDALLRRIDLASLLDDDPRTPEQRVEGLWSLLDGKDFHTVDRLTDENVWHGHALPDVLESWDFLLDMNRSRVEYEEA